MTRLLGSVIDAVVASLIVAALYLAWSGLAFVADPTGFRFPRPSFGLVLGVGLGTLALYLAGCWWVTGRSYGSHVMGLRVINWRGTRPSLPVALLRAGMCVLFPIGLFWVVVSPRNKSVQDLVVRTSVIYDWEPNHPSPQR
ncbi:MAG TPA: RDD family protein [Actinomycetes bacterium]|nr:RDD family protein [Actinomycetes bacterium]